MNFVAQLLLGLAAAFVSYLLTPRPEPPPPAELDDFDIPRAEEGAEIGYAAGSPWIKSAQVHWYGDFRSEAIKSSGSKK